MIRAKLLTYLCYGAMMSSEYRHQSAADFSGLRFNIHFPGASGTGLTQEESLGCIGSVAFIGLVFAILVTGPLADRIGAKTFALTGNILLAH